MVCNTLNWLKQQKNSSHCFHYNMPKFPITMNPISLIAKINTLIMFRTALLIRIRLVLRSVKPEIRFIKSSGWENKFFLLK